MGKIYVVGIGPGDINMMTQQAQSVLASVDVIVGYKTYIDLIKDHYPDREYFENGMKGEVERCGKCIGYAREGKNVALICSGDTGVYGMASPMLEIAAKDGFTDVEVIPGVTAALSGSAQLGAVLSHDFCVISLSDLQTPWELIEKRLKCAAEGDFAIAIYNPASKNRPDHLKKACNILMSVLPEDTACGYVRNIGRADNTVKTCTLRELADIKADMFVTVFIGNSQTKIEGGRLITPRGYRL